MYVKLWTGTRIPVVDREDAVRIIKSMLGNWMNPDDHIGWFNTDEDDRLNRKPSHAIVMTEHGEATDAEAGIIYKDMPMGEEGPRKPISRDRAEAAVNQLRARQKKGRAKPRLTKGG